MFFLTWFISFYFRFLVQFSTFRSIFDFSFNFRLFVQSIFFQCLIIEQRRFDVLFVVIYFVRKKNLKMKCFHFNFFNFVAKLIFDKFCVTNETHDNFVVIYFARKKNLTMKCFSFQFFQFRCKIDSWKILCDKRNAKLIFEKFYVTNETHDKFFFFTSKKCFFRRDLFCAKKKFNDKIFFISFQSFRFRCKIDFRKIVYDKRNTKSTCDNSNKFALRFVFFWKSRFRLVLFWKIDVTE